MRNDYLDKIDHFALYRDVPSVAVRRPLIENPVVSVIVPTFNRATLLAETLDSILAQQGFDMYEIVIVDNNPDPADATAKLLERYDDSRISYFKNEKNIGMYGNWNRAIELSRGEWICMIHDDDLLLPSYLATVTRIVNQTPGIGLLSVDSEWRNLNLETMNGASTSTDSLGACFMAFLRWLRETDNRVFPLQRLSLKDYILSYPHTTPGWCFRRDMALAVGGFDPTHYPCSDYYFSAKCCRHFNVYRYHRKLFIYRWSENESLKLNTRLDFVRLDHAFRLFLLQELGATCIKWSTYCVGLGSAIRVALTVPELSSAELDAFLSSIGIRYHKVSKWQQRIYFHLITRIFRFALWFASDKKAVRSAH